MRTLFIFCFLTMTLTSFAQATIKWKGGTPGSTTDWNTPSNWIPNRTPSAWDEVHIPDVSTSGNFYPVISSDVEPIQHLFIHSNAKLTIKEAGTLLIDVLNVYKSGIYNYGTLEVKGALFFENVPYELDPIDGNGKIITKPGRYSYSF